MEAVVQHIRAGIYVCMIVAFLMSLLHCSSCSRIPEKPTHVCFFPPDMVPHPHLPEPKKHPDTV